MDQQILDLILNNTHTINKLRHRVKLLKNKLITGIFASSTETEKELTGDDKKWLSSLDQNLLKQVNKDNIYQIFEVVEKQVNNLTTLVVYLGFDAPEEEVAKYAEWVKNNVGKSIILDIKYDPNLIAGCALVWKGVYKDYSLRATLQEKHEEILSSFKESLHRF